MNPEVLDVNRSLRAIVARLRDGQESDGSFRTLRRFTGAVESYVKPTEFREWHDFGSCPFATANIAMHLRDVDLPGVAEVREKACLSLAASMENGVARYVPGNTKPIDFPTDVDDTCLSAAALQANGLCSACNIEMVLDNQVGDGNIYTWLVPRWRHLRHPRNIAWLVRDYQEWKTRFSSYGLPHSHVKHMLREYAQASEPGIAANVLLFLRVTPQTTPMLAAMIKRIEADDAILGYYANPIAVYFHIARLYHSGVEAVGSLKSRIIAYLNGMQDADGAIDGPFNTALGALIYMYFGDWDRPELESAVRYLASHRMHQAGWEPFHYCNDLDGVFVDGGPELTAVFYLEALYRYHLVRDERALAKVGGGAR